MPNLLSDIQSLQTKGNDTKYPEGIFPSQRLHATSKLKREDDNVFFTALIVFTLQHLKKYFSPDELNIAEDISEKAKKSFALYENKKGEKTYNFWRTEKNAHFPNGKVFSSFDFLRLADDVDCTALVYLAKGYTIEAINGLKDKLLYHSTLPVEFSRNTLPHYKNLKLYSTWFGKNIPIEIDVCVTANLLYLLFESKSVFNEFDLASIKFVCSVINNDEHKKQAFRVAPYYPKTSIIFYHISRFLSIADHPELIKLKAKLKTDIFLELKEKIHPMERVILNTSLIWLGETDNIEELTLPSDRNYSWFIAGMLTSVENPIATWLASKPIFHIQFYCDAYMKALFLEYYTLRKVISRKN